MDDPVRKSPEGQLKQILYRCMIVTHTGMPR